MLIRPKIELWIAQPMETMFDSLVGTTQNGLTMLGYSPLLGGMDVPVGACNRHQGTATYVFIILLF